MPYLAMINMPGCLPDSEPVEFETIQEAKDYLLKTIRDDESGAEEENNKALKDLQENNFCYWQGYFHGIHETNPNIITAVGLAHWANYLINDDASGLSTEDKEQADKFREYIGGNIVDCKDVGFKWNYESKAFCGSLAGECCKYIAI